LTLSSNIFAFEPQEKTQTYNQVPSVVEAAFSQENFQHTLLAKNIVNSQTMPQSSTESTNEFLTAISVYLIIIIVYSIYGFTVSSKKIRA
jgi:hypothetical protein